MRASAPPELPPTSTPFIKHLLAIHFPEVSQAKCLETLTSNTCLTRVCCCQVQILQSSPRSKIQFHCSHAGSRRFRSLGNSTLELRTEVDSVSPGYSLHIITSTHSQHPALTCDTSQFFRIRFTTMLRFTSPLLVRI